MSEGFRGGTIDGGEQLSFETKLVTTPQGSKQKILLQDANGPCSLIALTNLLLLSKTHKRYCLELIQYMNSSQVVVLDDLVSILCAVAAQLNTLDDENSMQLDFDVLRNKVYDMYKGLVVDPKFDGNFKEDNNHDLNIFNIFQVPVVHGWCVEPVYGDKQSTTLLKYSYEEAQQVLLEAYQLNAGGDASSDPARSAEVKTEAGYIKPFLARTVRQLTEYGIKHINEILSDEDYVVFFRNDHFQTLYKEKGELYTLVTDTGYKNEVDIVWQSLKSVNGSEDIFYNAQFQVSSFHNKTAQGQNLSVANNAATTIDGDNGLTDEELARILQEEEDAKFAGNMQRRLENNDRRMAQEARDAENRESALSDQKNRGNKVKKSKKKKFKCIIL